MIFKLREIQMEMAVGNPDNEYDWVVTGGRAR